MRLAFCILLILPIFHFALAAPLAVGEMLEVRSNAIGVRKDEMAAWKKRMDSDDDDYAASAVSGGHAYDSGGDSDAGNDEEGDEEGVDAEGVREEDMLGNDTEQTESDAMEPDRDYDQYPDDDDDGAKSDDKNEGSGSDSDDGGNGSGGGHEAEGDDDHANDNDHSGPGYDSSFTSLSAVSRPATPERTADLEKMISAVKNILAFGFKG